MINKKITIRKYSPDHMPQLFSLLKREGQEWKDYWYDKGWNKYKNALTNSLTYLLYEGEELCGYARCRDDDGYGIYVYDLLVDKHHRGKEYGRLLLEHISTDFPDNTIYVMSDVDQYYTKLGYQKEGSIFVVRSRSCQNKDQIKESE